MKPIFWTGLTLSAAMILTPVMAVAERVCSPASEMEASLKDWYGETPVPGADAPQTQLWASEATGTWTLVKYRADGTSCVVAQGTDWAGEHADLMLAALGD
ncbi:S-adenosyl-L-homocysteine hydrolase [uncultured Tateyamaria sp.]|uniref:S-adenosyl-L-homocysteine hydrolase n=1 Tax=uncultured Tateyamaria sp. TaxID=455651 RepID=UPI00261CB5CE|nr:S-adenosyl-L-homocysteine hydrolase [uncultured Tateyamaria sp.]